MKWNKTGFDVADEGVEALVTNGQGDYVIATCINDNEFGLLWETFNSSIGNITHWAEITPPEDV